MTNNFFKTVAKSARDAAKDTAKQIAREPVEILRDTGSQAMNRPDIHTKDNEPSVMQQVMTGDGKVKDTTPEEERRIHSLAKQRLQEIEAELRKLRQEREQMSIDYAKEQQSLMDAGKPQAGEAARPVEMPSKPKHGGGGAAAAKRKQGTGEVAKQHKG